MTNNNDIILNKTKKNLNNLNINFILQPKNNNNMLLINLYIFIMYINLKLFSFKLNNNLTTYKELLEKINEIDNNKNTSQNELNSQNLNIIYNLMEYICYKGKFQIDIFNSHIIIYFLIFILRIIQKKVQKKKI